MLVAVLVSLAVPAGASSKAAKSGCKYLKVSEVNSITGLVFTKGPKTSAPPSSAVCGYAATDDPSVSVNLWVQRDSQVAAGFKAAKKAFAADVESATELGKKAIYVGGGINTAYVLQGKTLVYVQYVSLGSDDTVGIRDAVVEMTKVVLDRL